MRWSKCYCIAGKFSGEKVWRIDSFWAFGERKFGKFNRSANRLSIVSTKLDGFSLVNHGWFAKFAKLSPAKLFCYMVYLSLDSPWPVMIVLFDLSTQNTIIHG